MVLEFLNADVCSNCKQDVKKGSDYARYDIGKFCKLLSHAKVNSSCNTRFQLQSSTYLRNAVFTENFGAEAAMEGLQKKSSKNAEKSVGYVIDLIFGMSKLKCISADIEDFSTLSIPLCCKCVQYLTILYRSYVEFCELMNEESFLKKCIIQLDAFMTQAVNSASEIDEVQIKCEVDFDDNFHNVDHQSVNEASRLGYDFNVIGSNDRSHHEDANLSAMQIQDTNELVEPQKSSDFNDDHPEDCDYDHGDNDNYEPISNDFVPSGDEIDDIEEGNEVIKEELEVDAVDLPVRKSSHTADTVSPEISTAEDEIYATSSTCADLSKGPWVVIKKITDTGTHSTLKDGGRGKTSRLSEPSATGIRTSKRSAPRPPEIIVLSDDSADTGSNLSNGRRRSTRERAPVILMQVETKWKRQIGVSKVSKQISKSEQASTKKKGKKSAQRTSGKKERGAKGKQGSKTRRKSKNISASAEVEEVEEVDCAEESDNSGDETYTPTIAPSSRPNRRRAKRPRGKTERGNIQEQQTDRDKLNQSTRSVNRRYMRNKSKYRYPCWHCNEHFETQADCAAHTEKNHSKLGDFMCEACLRVCQNEAVYTAHLKVCANYCPGELTPPHPCPHCPKIFPIAYELKKHLDRHAPVKKFPCKKCNFRTTTNFLIKMHTKRMHPPPGKKMRTYPCKECGKVISSKVNLKSHIIRMHTEEGRKAYKKQLMQASSRNEERRKARAEARLLESYICEMCNVDCFSKRRLTAHRRIYHATDYKKYDYVCEQCGRDFRTHRILITHLQLSHTEDRPYICEQCGRSYKTLPNLNDHVKHTHSEEGRQIYNEKMRIHQRKRKQLLAAIAAKKKQAAAAVTSSVSSKVAEPTVTRTSHIISNISAPITTVADAVAAYTIPATPLPVAVPIEPEPKLQAPLALPQNFQQDLNFSPMNYNYNFSHTMPYPFNYPQE